MAKVEVQQQGANFETYKQQILQHVTEQVQNVTTISQQLSTALTEWMKSTDTQFDDVSNLIDKYESKATEDCDKRHEQITAQVKLVASTQAEHTTLLSNLTTNVTALDTRLQKVEANQMRAINELATIKTLVITLIVLLVALGVQSYVFGKSNTTTIIHSTAASDQQHSPNAQQTHVPAPSLVYMTGTYDKKLELAASVAKRLRKHNINVQFTEKDTGKQKHQVFWKLNSSSRGLSLSDVPSGKDVILIVLHLDGCTTLSSIAHPNHVQFCITDTDLSDDAVNELQLQELALLLNK